MILSDVLRRKVVDDSGRTVGRVVDVRFVLEGGETPSRARLAGFIVSPRSASSFIGYERATLDHPVILDRILHFIHRGSFLVTWEDVRRIDDEGVRLRADYRRMPSTLDD